jgi:hypothetical protein
MMVALATGVSGCGQTITWNKEGATQAEFNKDLYRCQQESLTGVHYNGVNYGYGFVGAQANRTMDTGLFKSCMMAGGYSIGKIESGIKEGSH